LGRLATGCKTIVFLSTLPRILLNLNIELWRFVPVFSADRSQPSELTSHPRSEQATVNVQLNYFFSSIADRDFQGTYLGLDRRVVYCPRAETMGQAGRDPSLKPFADLVENKVKKHTMGAWKHVRCWRGHGRLD
jgi:hypothetical protein